MKSYVAPVWASSLGKIPHSYYPLLGGLVSPIQRVAFQLRGEGTERTHYSISVKRDDTCGFGAHQSGNKIRKLQFIFAELTSQKCDAIVSIGGTQSNHARAVSAIAAALAVPCFHVLRKDKYFNEELHGNRLLMNLLGSTTFLVDKATYRKHGQQKLLERCGAVITERGLCKKPYLLPVGGSVYSAIFGYVDCIAEIEQQISNSPRIDTIAFAAGSGGTAAGLALGLHLSSLTNIKLIGYIVCDTPAYFYDHVQEMIDESGLTLNARDLVEFRDVAVGVGYALNTDEEIDFIRQVARTSGMLVDGTYTAKALRGCVLDGLAVDSTLFIHTGGGPSLESISHLLTDHDLIQELPISK